MKHGNNGPYCSMDRKRLQNKKRKTDRLRLKQFEERMEYAGAQFRVLPLWIDLDLQGRVV